MNNKLKCHKISLCYNSEVLPRYEITEHGYLIRYYIEKEEFNSKLKRYIVLLNRDDLNFILEDYEKLYKTLYKNKFLKKVDKLFDKYYPQDKKQIKKLEKKLMNSMDENESNEYGYFKEEYNITNFK